MSGRPDLDALATERANPRTKDLDLLATEDLLRAMNAEDRRPAEAVGEVLPALARAVDLATDRLRRGGRMLYVGAGTSGRLGVLDASELPPTFGVDAALVQGAIAGGDRALRDAIEGAEDDPALGAADVRAAGIGVADVVVGVAASGRTPYVLGALAEARARGAATVAVVCNRPTPAHAAADVVVDPVVGEEVLAGSTRLKAGTAQKLVLNALSTAVMVRLGRTYGNLMVGVAATNEKLRLRAQRLVVDIVGVDAGTAAAALAAASWDVRTACVMLRRGVPADAARAALAAAGGRLRDVL
jgi:N-acetylmuramic acid 6-phosphate etherase